MRAQIRRQTNNIKIVVYVLYFLYLVLSIASAVESKPLDARISQDGIQRAEIIVDSYSFEPDRIVVVVGKPVELDLRSVTSIIPHNFSIDHPEAGMDIDQNIAHGEDVKVTFTPTKTGSYEFYCNKKGLFGSHRKKGMEGTIEVKE